MNDGFATSVVAALELVEDFAMAHCIERQASAVLILRDDLGNEYRRLVGPKGVSEIPESFDDATVLARLAVVRTASSADLLALDATIASGGRILIV